MRIEKNIQVPDLSYSKTGRVSPVMELISQMNFGDSVLFKTRKRANYFCVQIRYFLKTRKQLGRACIRSMPEGFRVWLLPPYNTTDKYAHAMNGLQRKQNEIEARSF